MTKASAGQAMRALHPFAGRRFCFSWAAGYGSVLAGGSAAVVYLENIELAKSHVQSPAAPGGVSLTLLTLALTLREEVAEQRLFSSF